MNLKFVLSVLLMDYFRFDVTVNNEFLFPEMYYHSYYSRKAVTSFAFSFDLCPAT